MDPTSTTSNEANNQSAAMEQTPPKRKTVWTLKQRIIRFLWGTLGKLMWCVFPCCRSGLIRLFGGSIGKNCSFARLCEITIPWNLIMGDDCKIASHVILYSLGTITLGNNVRIDMRAHLCAGSHDMRDTTFPLTRPPIFIGDFSYIGVDAFIAPNVSLGEHSVVHPRASVYKNFDGHVELIGNPAKEMS